MNIKIMRFVSSCSVPPCHIKCLSKAQFVALCQLLRLADPAEVDILFEMMCDGCGISPPTGPGGGGPPVPPADPDTERAVPQLDVGLVDWSVPPPVSEPGTVDPGERSSPPPGGDSHSGDTPPADAPKQGDHPPLGTAGFDGDVTSSFSGKLTTVRMRNPTQRDDTDRSATRIVERLRADGGLEGVRFVYRLLSIMIGGTQNPGYFADPFDGCRAGVTESAHCGSWSTDVCAVMDHSVRWGAYVFHTPWTNVVTAEDFARPTLVDRLLYADAQAYLYACWRLLYKQGVTSGDLVAFAAARLGFMARVFNKSITPDGVFDWETDGFFHADRRYLTPREEALMLAFAPTDPVAQACASRSIRRYAAAGTLYIVEPGETAVKAAVKSSLSLMPSDVLDFVAQAGYDIATLQHNELARAVRAESLSAVVARSFTRRITQGKIGVLHDNGADYSSHTVTQVKSLGIVGNGLLSLSPGVADAYTTPWLDHSGAVYQQGDIDSLRMRYVTLREVLALANTPLNKHNLQF